MPPGYPSKCARAQMASAKTNSAKSSGVMQTIVKPTVDLEGLRKAIQEEYSLVAEEPEHGFHFFVGRPLARMLGYDEEWLDGVPEGTIASFAGTGNPFSLGALGPGERVVDVGSGGGIDSLIAAKMVGPGGRVIGVDMTPAMLDKARTSAATAGLKTSSSGRGSARRYRSRIAGPT